MNLTELGCDGCGPSTPNEPLFRQNGSSVGYYYGHEKQKISKPTFQPIPYLFLVEKVPK